MDNLVFRSYFHIKMTCKFKSSTEMAVRDILVNTIVTVSSQVCTRNQFSVINQLTQEH